MILPEEQTALWRKYLEAEANASRPEKMQALDALLNSLMSVPESLRFAWARDIARRVVDTGENIPVRMPLFRQAIFPALLAGCRKGQSGCARWLAGLDHLLCQCRECLEQLPEAGRSGVGLLRQALRHDPSDRLAQRKLLGRLASQLDYSLHELPAGVLYGTNGATIAECGELEAELAEFWNLAQQERAEEQYQELAEACRYHFRHYRNYLLHREQYAGYAAYLQEIEPQPSMLGRFSNHPEV